MFSSGYTDLISDQIELSSWGKATYITSYITLYLLVCGCNSKCGEDFALENERATVQMMDEFASAVIENEQAKDLPTCLPFGSDSSSGSFHLQSSPSEGIFFCFVILVG